MHTSSALSLWASRTTNSSIIMVIQVLMNSKAAWRMTIKNSRRTSKRSSKSSYSNSRMQLIGLLTISREETTRRIRRLTILIFRHHLVQCRVLMNCNSELRGTINQQLKATCFTITKGSWIKWITRDSKEKNDDWIDLFIIHMLLTWTVNDWLLF